jgi:hypothetical protein
MIFPAGSRERCRKILTEDFEAPFIKLAVNLPGEEKVYLL